jgi:hypothetical protein
VPNLQTGADIKFYQGINTITTLEMGELCKIEDEFYEGIEKSQNLQKRLSGLLEDFKLEIRNNLLLLSENQKIALLDTHLEEANRYLLAYKKEYDGYIEKEPSLYWIKPQTHEKIIFIYKLIEFIGDKTPKATKDEHTPIYPLDSIDPALIQRFKKIEDSMNAANNWPDSVIRLAAFCELLYEKKYFTVKPSVNKGRPVKFMNTFAKSRYGIDINNALKATKKKERENHKSKKIQGLNSLNSYLK